MAHSVNTFIFQNYPSDKMAKVVAKKWGYATPEEYYDLANVKDNPELRPPVVPEQPKQVCVFVFSCSIY